MELKVLSIALVSAGLLGSGAAVAAPATLGTMNGLATQADVTLVRDGEEFSGITRRNYTSRWGRYDRPNRYRYGAYRGHRGYPYGYRRYGGPGFGLGLGAYSYGYGPSFGIYVNP